MQQICSDEKDETLIIESNFHLQATPAQKKKAAATSKKSSAVATAAAAAAAGYELLLFHVIKFLQHPTYFLQNRQRRREATEHAEADPGRGPEAVQAPDREQKSQVSQ